MVEADGRLRRDVLPGGLRVVAERVPGSRSVALGVGILSGSRHEPRHQAGMSHFVEHMLFRGTRRHSALALAQAMERLGGQVDAATTRESTVVYARIQPTDLKRCLALLQEMVCEPLFAPDLVEKEKKVVLEEIRSYEDDPEEAIHDVMAGLLWPDHPMGRPILGYERTVRSFRARDIREFHARRYRGGQVVVAAAGDLDPGELAPLVRRMFRLPPGKPRLLHRAFRRMRPRCVHVRRPISRAHLLLATRGPSYRHRGRHAAYLLNLILGGGTSSRLFQRIREREGMAYAIHSFLDSYEDTGVFGIYLSVDPRNLRRAYGVVRRELAKLMEDGVRRWELESAKSQMILMHLLSQENVGERMGRLILKEMLFGAQPPDGKVAERVRAVTAEGIMRTARRLLRPERFCVVTMGPDEDPGLPPMDGGA
jgi:predicted Zn-dependent peptidase